MSLKTTKNEKSLLGHYNSSFWNIIVDIKEAEVTRTDLQWYVFRLRIFAANMAYLFFSLTFSNLKCK